MTNCLDWVALGWKLDQKLSSHVWHFMAVEHTLREIWLWTQANKFFFLTFLLKSGFFLHSIVSFTIIFFWYQHVRVSHFWGGARTFIFMKEKSWPSTWHHLIHWNCAKPNKDNHNPNHQALNIYFSLFFPSYIFKCKKI